MGIDDLLEKAISPEHGRNADNLHKAVLESRILFLMEYFPRGLEGDEKSRWNTASPEERIEMMQEKNYMLKPEHAYQLIRRMAVYILKKHNKAIGEELEKAFNTRYDESKSEEERAEAARTIEMLKPTLGNLGFDMASLEEHAVEKGFDMNIWNQFTESLPIRYRALYTRGYVDLLSDNEIYSMVDQIGAETGLKADIVKGKKRDEIISVLIDYKQYQRGDDIKGFKQKYTHWH